MCGKCPERTEVWRRVWIGELQKLTLISISEQCGSLAKCTWMGENWCHSFDQECGNRWADTSQAVKELSVENVQKDSEILHLQVNYAEYGPEILKLKDEIDKLTEEMCTQMLQVQRLSDLLGTCRKNLKNARRREDYLRGKVSKTANITATHNNSLEFKRLKEEVTRLKEEITMLEQSQQEKSWNCRCSMKIAEDFPKVLNSVSINYWQQM